ncbi:MAG: glycoside hydrolase family 31 protein [Saprospiraceae bacterium]
MIKKTTPLTEVNQTETADMVRYPDVYTEYIPDTVTEATKTKRYFLFRSQNNIQLRVYPINHSTLRFRYAHNGIFAKDFSYAIPNAPKVKTKGIELTEKPRYFEFRTKQLSCRIDKKTLAVKLIDQQGKIICEDAAGYYAKSTVLKGLTNISIEKKALSKEVYLGLGDKSGNSNLRGQKLENWNTDAFAYGKNTDPLYRSVPFYYALHQGRAYGIFLDNTYRSHFDFDHRRKGKLSFSVAGGEMNYYFIYGPQLDQVAMQYAQLTGVAELPPMWALGFHQCRWSYYPEARVKEIAAQFRALNIPCDAIYLDIDYMEEYRCFTWDEKLFPNPKKMIKGLKKDGFKTIVMIDPGIMVDEEYEVYQSGMQEDVFCKRPDGDLMIASVWPPACVFPDFTKASVRTWWGNLYQKLYQEQDVAGFWNDMNEPAIFQVDKMTFPEDVRHDYDGHPCSHKKAHNIYGMQMSKATQEGLKDLRPQQRPFLLSRASFSGGQRYAAIWTGDNIANWEHLQIANTQCQRMSISGFSFIGTDIGGFVDQPDGELFVRWLQMGIFHPFFRVHSIGNKEDGAALVDQDKVAAAEKTNRLDQEPWAFGDEYTDLARLAIEMRYRLLPYLYTSFWQHSTTGIPMIRSMAFYDQTDPMAVQRDQEFMFGANLLIAPVTKSQQKTQTIYLPKGNWYNYYTGERFEGKQKIRHRCQLDQIPIFVKAGTVLPEYPVQQFVGEKKIKRLSLKVYADQEKQHSVLYEDQGDDYQYLDDAYALKVFTTEASKDRFTVSCLKTGQYQESYHKYKLELHGLDFDPQKCLVDDQPQKIKPEMINDRKVYHISLKKHFEEIVITA